VADRVEERPDIRVEDPIDPLLPQPVRQRIQRIVLSTLRPEAVAEPQELRLVDRRQDRRHRRLDNLVLKFQMPALLGLSGDPKGDVERAYELESKALALDPDDFWAHSAKGWVLLVQSRNDEAVAEFERALAMDPTWTDADVGLGFVHLHLREFDKSIEYRDKAIRVSPYDRSCPLLVRRQGTGQFRAEGL
jgi:tetratricopeptide (TPR) repeat protein